MRKTHSYVKKTNQVIKIPNNTKPESSRTCLFSHILETLLNTYNTRKACGVAKTSLHDRASLLRHNDDYQRFSFAVFPPKFVVFCDDNYGNCDICKLKAVCEVFVKSEMTF